MHCDKACVALDEDKFRGSVTFIQYRRQHQPSSFLAEFYICAVMSGRVLCFLGVLVIVNVLNWHTADCQCTTKHCFKDASDIDTMKIFSHMVVVMVVVVLMVMVVVVVVVVVGGGSGRSAMPGNHILVISYLFIIYTHAYQLGRLVASTNCLVLTGLLT